MEPEKKKHPLTALAFLEIGLFEIVFVITGVLLLLGTINYFNLLPVSKVFPKYLGWLPKQKVKINNNQIYNDFLKQYYGSGGKPTPTPLSSPTPQGSFQYDAKKAETILTQYIKETIKQEFLQEKIKITQGQQIDGVKSNLPYEFGWYSQSDTASIGATLHFAENTNVIESKEIFMEVNINNLKEPNITADSANPLLNLYLEIREQIQPSDCKTISSLSYCQVFKQDANGKKGFGIIMLNKGSFSVIQKSHLILFSCSLSKEGNSYKSQQSCLKQF